MKEQELREAYSAGLSKLNHGANDENCNFRHFTSRAKTRAWEKGVAGQPFNLEEILLESI